MGKINKGGFTKLRMQMDSNKPPKVKRPKAIMVNNIKELFK